jgi:hypothetical protein
MKRAAKSLPADPGVPLPRLSDDAAAEIYLFIEHALLLFEDRYGDQLRRFYESMSRDNLLESQLNLELDDPPF